MSDRGLVWNFRTDFPWVTSGNFAGGGWTNGQAITVYRREDLRPDLALQYGNDKWAFLHDREYLEARFAQWYDLLGAGNGAGDAVMVARGSGEVVLGLSAPDGRAG